MGNLLNFSGRVRRMGFWIVAIAIGIVNSILYTIANSMATGDNPSWFVLILIYLVLFALSLVSLSVSVRRWHDLDKSGWWVLIGLIPFVGWIYALYMCGFKSGDQGPNTFGPAPMEGAIL